YYHEDIIDGRQEKSEAGMMWAFDAASGEGWGVFPRKTREIVEDAQNMGCDGVIFHNVVDNGGGIREADADDVYVVMKPEQVKSVDDMTYADDGSIIPAEKRLDWTNPDIRWSIGGVHGAMMAGRTGDFDSAWRMLERNYNPLYVWKKTGFWRGKDRHLRFEIPDGKMKDAETILKVLKEGKNSALLSDVMDAPELFKAYPDLARLKVHFNSDAVKNGEAHYSPAEDAIYVGFAGGLRPMSDHDKSRIEHWKRVIDDPERRRIHISNSKFLGLDVGTDEDVIRTAKEKIAEIEGGQLRTDRIWAGHTAGDHVRDILIHEIQHAIQQRERFAKGMSDNVARKYAQEILGSTNADDAWLTEARQNTEELIAAQAELKLRKYVRFGDVENAKPEEWSPEALKRLDRFTKDGSWQQYGDSWSTPRKSRSKKRQKLRHEQIIKAIKRMVDEEVMSKHPEYRDKTNAELEDVIRAANKWSRDHFERVQDAKDKRELASKLATMSDYEIYLAFAGEVEARQAVARAKMSDAEREETPPWESEDTPRGGQIVRWSVEVSPTLREDVTAALNTDRTKGEIVKGEKRVVFCDTPGLLRHVGVPQAKIYSKAYALRKIVTDHKVTAEQIAGAPELMNHPAAIFNDNGEGYV
ncbi:MAG: hypothetical protein KBT68_11390, partial [bacterium]|nr:hypothetical protein [Candidatus Colisoma equi]